MRYTWRLVGVVKAVDVSESDCQSIANTPEAVSSLWLYLLTKLFNRKLEELLIWL